ncbi:hypothetical protein P170DRAFT_433435 [Aspergillus steynii IBT 23096]|uniref:Uncharacterized protein n=1 Tax=Aspergillus steynii IBT 23096 TaxID=1392250 RepID=A0A2I2GF23_9EURO|nr:uncharacterized protein P170DRAFT_433435 [Aspergillus steynii IBT 23096]PLB51427.1 hypothetical protein P170DRAFT_433435 [Aspergillus steynii IBT 23096]
MASVSGVWFLFLGVVATALLWGASLWNGTVKELILTAYYGKFQDGTPFHTNYTGFLPLDFPIAVLVAFFYYGTNGSHPGYQHFLVDAYSTLQLAFVWLYVEGLRLEDKPYSVAKPVLWGLLWQAIGGAIAWPIYFFYHIRWFNTRQGPLRPVSLPSAKALPFSFLLGAVLPAVIGMLPTWLPRLPHTHQSILAAWQPDPVWVAVIQAGFTKLFSSPEDASKAVWWTKASLLLSAVACTIGHTYTMWTVLTSSDERLSFARMYIPHLVDGPRDAAALLASGPWLFLQYDLIIYSLASVSWAYLLVARLVTPGALPRLVVLPALFVLGSVILGPGAAVSLALFWREGTVIVNRKDAKLSKRSLNKFKQ